MSHYFQNDPLLASKKRDITLSIDGLTLHFKSDNGVFSKSKVDEGSLALLKVIIPLHLTGKILDLGCGYGPIGLTIAVTSPSARVDLADINERALALCEENAQLLGLSQRITCLQSDIYTNVEGPYDSIVVNPPIRAGKRVTYKMYEGALQRLIDGGSLYVVIRKDQGAPTASRFIEGLFGNISLISRDKGYYIYQAKKVNK
ncbi:MAG: class I SAM-dependent methyltransferase [Methanomicrobia archaeon]|jgi:16S rRNA (guanine1207-N2)-methyltransferase|nr:methyltransferase [Bacilli bacterium]MDD3068792.1 methyltransferase [Bacilli bacterium]MDD3841565.1 methyltransferase [Bacilli bacterium]NCA95403.1 class I SAM-dependent methyltransferase [Methanomicrobia archaeon]HKM10190.1 methyltransferase [Bacilli bacterium]